MPRGKAGVPPEDPKDLIVDKDPLGVGEEPAQEAAPAEQGDIIDAEVADDDEPREPVTHAPITFTREFRRHKRTGQIFAIELAGGQLNAARELVRPEEMTHGALPVLTLYTGEDVARYRDAAGWCEPWEPKHTPESAVKRMAALEEEVQTIDGRIEKKKAETKKLNADRERKLAEIRRLIQQARAGQLDLLDGVPVVGGGPVEEHEEPLAEPAAPVEVVEAPAPEPVETTAATLPA